MKNIRLAILCLACCTAQAQFSQTPAFRAASVPRPASGGGGGGGWTPATPANTIKQWIRPEELSADPITTWTAHVGRDLLLNTGTAPAKIAAAHNGQPIARFTESGTLATNFASSQNFPYTIGYIFKYTGDTGAFRFLFDGGISGNDTVVRLLSGNFETYSDNAPTPGLIGAADNNWHVILVTINGASGTVQADGGLEVPAVGMGNASMGGITLAGSDTGSALSSIDVQEVVVWDGVLSSGDKSSWFTYGTTTR